jgi:hypothetical protein
MAVKIGGIALPGNRENTLFWTWQSDENSPMLDLTIKMALSGRALNQMPFKDRHKSKPAFPNQTYPRCFTALERFLADRRIAPMMTY